MVRLSVSTFTGTLIGFTIGMLFIMLSMNSVGHVPNLLPLAVVLGIPSFIGAVFGAGAHLEAQLLGTSDRGSMKLERPAQVIHPRGALRL